MGRRSTPGGVSAAGSTVTGVPAGGDAAGAASVGVAAGASAAAASGPRASRKERMSSRVTRPEMPEPSIWVISTSCSAAILRTRGVERVRRRSSRVAGAATVAAGAWGAGGASASATDCVTAAGSAAAACLAGGSSGGGAWAGASSTASAGGPPSAAAATASVSMRATRVPTSTVSPSATRISARTPLEGDGMSASTLSVEISKRSSSRSTSSPSRFSHLVSVPSAIDSPIWGMITSTLAMQAVLP